jgi:hypothetical protein
MVNNKCHRSAILRALGEEKLPSEASISMVPPELCCSGCNPSLFPSFPEPPNLDTLVVKRPARGSSAGIALEALDKWAIEQAKLYYSFPQRRYTLSPAAFLEVDSRYRLACLFEPHRKVDWRSFSVKDAEREAPRLRQWRHRERAITPLVEELRRMGSTIRRTVSEIARIRRDERAAAMERLARTTFTPLPPSLERHDLAEWLKSKDDNLARQVARRTFGQSLARATSALPPTNQSSAIRPDRYKTPDAPTCSPFNQSNAFDSPLAPECSPLSALEHPTPGARTVSVSTSEVILRLRESYRQRSQSPLSQRRVASTQDLPSQYVSTRNVPSQRVPSGFLLSQAASSQDQSPNLDDVLSEGFKDVSSNNFDDALLQSALARTPKQPRFQYQYQSEDHHDMVVVQQAKLRQHQRPGRAPLQEKDPNVVKLPRDPTAAIYRPRR